MKKSNFAAMVSGIISGVLFALGMCMALISEWNVFWQGVIIGSIGLVLGLITVIAWRKAEHKMPIKFNARTVLLCIFAAVGVLVFSVGMCFCMVWENIVLGTAIGLVGILLLLALIPIVKGLK